MTNKLPMPPKWWRRIMWLLFAVHYQYPTKPLTPCNHKWEEYGSYTMTGGINHKIVTDDWTVMVCWKCCETKDVIKLGKPWGK